MKIGIDARMYGAKATTGIGVYVKNLIEQLSILDLTNEYVIFMKDPEFSNFELPSVKFTKVKLDLPWYSLKEQLLLPIILKQYRLDLMHFPQFNVPIFYPGKYVVTIHDITPKFFPGPNVKKSIIKKLGYEIIFRLGLIRAKKILTGSNHTKQQLLTYYKVKLNKIVVIPLGFDTRLAKKVAVAESLTLTTKFKITKPFLLYVGVWRDHKNLPGLITAFNILKSQYRLGYQLVLAGQQDPRYPEIQTAIQQSPFKQDIITPGFVSTTELQVLYQQAKLFILPSFCEGFGLVALEAQSVGTPVVASNTTSLPEILETSAKYFDPNKPEEIALVINTILTNDELYTDLVDRGLKQVEKYNWATTAQATASIYRSC